MENNISKKEEAAFGVFTGVALATFVVLILIGYAPASYYLGKWEEYWQEKDQRENSFENLGYAVLDVYRRNMADGVTEKILYIKIKEGAFDRVMVDDKEIPPSLN